MMRWLRFCSFLACLTSPVAAQTIEVRSGDHENFVRLIVDLPSRLEPKIENGRDESTVSFTQKGLSFDTSRIFRRIARDRVTDVSAGISESTLRIELGCACKVSHFWHGASLLVLDIIERPDTLPEVEETEVEPETRAAISSGHRITVQQGPPSLAASLAKPQLQPKAPVDIPQNTQETETITNENRHDEALLREAREQLVQQLGRAASQGLLSPKPGKKPLQNDGTKDPEPEETVEIIDQVTHDSALEHVNLHAQSSIDRDFMSVLKGGSSNRPQSVCLSGPAIDVSSWGADEGFSEQIGPLRKNLLGEFDRLNTDGVLALARLYLYFGFGVEAKDTLSMLNETTETKAVLYSLADIMENGFSEPPSVLSGQLNCDGPAALWSILSHENLPEDLPINKNAAILAFDALPRHLRSHLGPILSRRFMDAGDNKSANKILRILRRSTTDSPPSADLVDAEISRSEGDYPAAISELDTVVQSNSEPSAEALISLIETSLQTGTIVSFENAVLAGAYVQQYRDEPMEKDLVRVYLSGLAASGAFDQSYRERARLADTLAPLEKAMVDSEMLKQLVQRADDVTFLKHVMAAPPDRHEMILPEVANETAERLLETGFTDYARSFIEKNADGKAGRERQMLKAKISLNAGNPHQVEVDLFDLEGEEVDRLRAEARGLIGDHNTAAKLYSENGMSEQSLRQSWLAEDWERLRLSDDSTFSDGAALASLDAQPAETETEGVLSQNRGLIQQSSAARNTINDILSASPLPKNATENPE